MCPVRAVFYSFDNSMVGLHIKHSESSQPSMFIVVIVCVVINKVGKKLPWYFNLKK
jgi:hypothetical protein